MFRSSFSNSLVKIVKKQIVSAVFLSCEPKFQEQIEDFWRFTKRGISVGVIISNMVEIKKVKTCLAFPNFKHEMRQMRHYYGVSFKCLI